MRTWLANLWISVTAGFWFVPGLMLVAGVLLGVMLPEVDHQTGDLLPTTLRVSPETARLTLSSLLGAMITITGIVFSTTTVAISITSAQIGPRLLRNFFGQSVTQVTLGLCLGASAYCLVLLRRVDPVDGEIFVPDLALLAASVSGLLTLMAIVYFIHQVARSIQIQNVASDVADELEEAIRRLYPTEDDHPAEERRRLREAWDGPWRQRAEAEPTHVLSHSDGYLQAIEPDGVARLACRCNAFARACVRPGDYVRRGDRLLEWRGDPPCEEGATRLRRAFLLGNQRTPQQDVECSVNELVEIAMRALSPGVNDPFTAMTCIDRLSGSLRTLLERPTPSGVSCDGGDRPRLLCEPRASDAVIDAAFDQLRQHSRGNVAVTIRLLEAIGATASAASREEDRRALRRQAELIAEAADAAGHVSADLEAIAERRAAVDESLRD